MRPDSKLVCTKTSNMVFINIKIFILKIIIVVSIKAHFAVENWKKTIENKALEQ